MEVLHQRCAGLDVHKDTVVACVRIAAAGETRRDVRTFTTTTRELLALADWVKAVPGRKSDVGDATWLADLDAHGLIRASFVPDAATQELRGLLRTRKQLVREQVGHTQRIQKVLEDANIKLDSVIADVVGVSGRRMIEALIAGESNPATLASLAHRRLRASPQALADALHGRVIRHHRFLLALHRRQIGRDMGRFASAGHLVSWAGLCPKSDESAGKRRSTRLRKGAPWLKTTLIQCAWAAARTPASYCHAQFHRLRARRGAKKAVVANPAFNPAHRLQRADLASDAADVRAACQLSDEECQQHAGSTSTAGSARRPAAVAIGLPGGDARRRLTLS